MLRHCSKFPLGIVTKSGAERQYYVRFFRTTSYNLDKSEQKKKCPKEGSGRGFYYTLGAVVLGVGGAIAYAKHDPEFRKWLEETVPGTDGFIAFVAAEETSHVDYLVRYIQSLKRIVWTNILNLLGHDKSKTKKDDTKESAVPCDAEGKPYIAPPSAFKSLVEKEEPAHYVEVRVARTTDDPKDANVDVVPGTQKPTLEQELKELGPVHPKNLVNLESQINTAADAAIAAYSEAICILREHAEDIYVLVEESVENVDPNIWPTIKKKGEERERLIKIAEENAKRAMQSVSMLQKFMDDPKLPGGDDVRNRAKRNLEKVTENVKEAKEIFEKERKRVAITEKYWGKVQEARKHFSEELEILFPNVRLSDRQLKLAEGEVDLFILYAFQNILYYQKELSRLDTISTYKLNTAIETIKQHHDPDLTEACVEQEIEKYKRKYGLEVQKKMLVLRAECERSMREQMKRHAQAYSDQLSEAMAIKEKEMQRHMQREMEDKLMEEKTKFKEEIAAVVGQLKGMDDAVRKRALQDKKAQQSQILWSACQTLEAALRAPAKCLSSASGDLRPLNNEVTAISKAAAPTDELVQVVVKSLPEEVTARGVYNDTILKERFVNVERVAKRVALLPEGGASLPLMFLSYLQSIFIITPSNPIPAYELANEPFEPSKFNTFEILQRARYWLDRGDFFQTLRYMNLLEGAPRVVALEWMKETRIYLETLQAARVLMAHASAAGLSFS